jgi:hypothetical protein
MMQQQMEQQAAMGAMQAAAPQVAKGVVESE